MTMDTTMFKKILMTAKLMFPYKIRLFFFITIGFIYGGINLGFVQVSKFSIDLLDSYRKGQKLEELIPASLLPWIPSGWMEVYTLFYICVGILTLLLLALCVTIYFRAYLQQWFCARIMVDMRNRVCERLLTLDYAFYSRYNTGDLISRISADLALLVNAILQFGVLLTRPVTVVIMVCSLFWINWELALYGLVGMPAAIISMRYLSRKMRLTSRRALEKTADVSQTLMQFLTGIATVKAFACEKFEYQNIREQNEELFRLTIKREGTQARERPLMSFTSKIGLVFVIFIGGRMVIEGKLDYGEIVAFLAALGFMYEPGKELSRSNAELQNDLPGAERFFEILEQKPVTQDGTIVMPPFEKQIEFRDVDFAYKPDSPVLQGFNLTINKGETIALVGASGAGKSTLINLLLRFYDVQSGAILIDGRDLRELTFESLRGQLALVGQSPFLFNSTIRSNIAYGRADFDEEELLRAARAANIHDEIMAQPNGYDTVVGERGENLSGGQRQRLTIARAIFKNPPILLLDEATSALDSENERKVQDALESLMKNRTSLVVAHRLSTILHADRIVVMQEGQIVGIGKHNELLSSCDTYRRLALLQGLDRQEAL